VSYLTITLYGQEPDCPACGISLHKVGPNGGPPRLDVKIMNRLYDFLRKFEINQVTTYPDISRILYSAKLRQSPHSCLSAG